MAVFSICSSNSSNFSIFQIENCYWLDGSFTVVRVGSSVGGSGSIAGPANVLQQVQNQPLVFAPASPVGPR